MAFAEKWKKRKMKTEMKRKKAKGHEKPVAVVAFRKFVAASQSMRTKSKKKILLIYVCKCVMDHGLLMITITQNRVKTKTITREKERCV